MKNLCLMSKKVICWVVVVFCCMNVCFGGLTDVRIASLSSRSDEPVSLSRMAQYKTVWETFQAGYKQRMGNASALADFCRASFLVNDEYSIDPSFDFEMLKNVTHVPLIKDLQDDKTQYYMRYGAYIDDLMSRGLRFAPLFAAEGDRKILQKGIEHTLRLFNVYYLLKNDKYDEYVERFCAQHVGQHGTVITRETFALWRTLLLNGHALLERDEQNEFETLVIMLFLLHDIGEFVAHENHPELGEPIARAILEKLARTNICVGSILTSEMIDVLCLVIFNHVNVGTAFYGERHIELTHNALGVLPESQRDLANVLLRFLTFADTEQFMTDEKAQGYYYLLGDDQFYDSFKRALFLRLHLMDSVAEEVYNSIPPFLVYRLCQFERHGVTANSSKGDIVRAFVSLKMTEPLIAGRVETIFDQKFRFIDYGIFFMNKMSDGLANPSLFLRYLVSLSYSIDGANLMGKERLTIEGGDRALDGSFVATVLKGQLQLLPKMPSSVEEERNFCGMEKNVNFPGYVIPVADWQSRQIAQEKVVACVVAYDCAA